MQTIDAVLAANCLKFSGKTALRYKSAGSWQPISYHQLWQQAGEVASGLQNWGVRPGDRIGILAPSSPRWVITYLGILRSGAIAVPIDKDLKSAELRHVLSDSGARCLFTESSFLEPISEIAEELSHLEKIVLIQEFGSASSENRLPGLTEALFAEWGRITDKYRLPPEDSARMNDLTRTLRQLIGETRPKPQSAIPQGLFGQDELQRRQALEALKVEYLAQFALDIPPAPSSRTSQEVAVILYTSGTTGRSKGAMLTHENILTNILAAVDRFRVGSTIHTLSFLPINHVFEQVCGILLPLYVGGTVSFAESIKRLGQNLAEVQPNFLLGVPAVFRLLLDRIRKNIQGRRLSRSLFAFPLTRPLIISKVKKSLGENATFISGGAALDPEVAAGLRELGISVYQGYGITETSPVISFESPGQIREGSVGHPIPGLEVRIDDPNDEGIGEIVVRGPNVMKGYYNQSEATEEVLVEGWYSTGDLGRFDEEGYLYICGRKKNLIVTSNGKNVYPEEVEIELLKSRFIAETMVYGHKLSPTTEEVYALIYPDQEALDAYAGEKGLPSLKQRQIEDLIRKEVLEAGKRLADYKRVKKFTLREDEFPKTTTRKIKRFAVEADIPADGV